MKAVKIQTDGTIQLPREVLRMFPRASELVVWSDGDMIVFKRLRPLLPSQVAERAPGREMSLSQIAAEVHRMRRAQRARRP